MEGRKGRHGWGRKGGSGINRNLTKIDLEDKQTWLVNRPTSYQVSMTTCESPQALEVYMSHNESRSNCTEWEYQIYMNTPTT